MSYVASMTWDIVMGEVIIPMLEADAQLIAELEGNHIYTQEASRPVRVPSIVWDMLDDQLTELFNPIHVQMDLFARNRASAVIIERRLRLLLHRDTRRQIGELDLSTLYEDSFSHDYPIPGIVHRSLRFTFEPARRIVAALES